MSVVCIIQARLSSTRLPRKALREVAGAPLTQRVVERVSRSGVDAIVLAVPQEDYDGLRRFISRGARPPVMPFAGSRDDVLSRYYDAARWMEATVIVRVTGDCPLVDPAVIDACVERFLAGGADYLSTSHPDRTLPSGFDVEVFSFDALREAHFGCGHPDHREHVTQHIYRAAEMWPVPAGVGELYRSRNRQVEEGRACRQANFRCATFAPESPWPVGVPMPHLSVDTEDDLCRVERVLAACGENAGWREYAETATLSYGVR